MKKNLDFEKMSLPERRRFLKILGTVLLSPFVPPSIRFGCMDILMGEAYAETFSTTIPTNFIEINLRDQFDILHAIVPPGLATYPNLRRGLDQNIPLFNSPANLKKVGNNFYINTEGVPLIPHLDSIAVIETTELSLGVIHGHEAANALRSPGRNYNAGQGRTPMWNIDGQFSPAILSGDFGGNDQHYSATPTPAILHNYYQRQLNKTLRRGVAYKGLGRGDKKHAIYHHAANLQDAQIDRYADTNSLLNAFANTATTPTLLAQNKDLITRLLNQVDAKFLNKLKYTDLASTDHLNQIKNLGNNLTNQNKPFNLSLSESERAYWTSGISTDGYTTFNGSVAAIGEQAGYGAKLITAGVLRTFAIEFCYGDVHGSRPEQALRAQGTQFANPLARLIETFKAAGIYDNTVIAIYTTDGGRGPVSDSFGDYGKNAVILAGGRIKGGYYGDIRIAGDNGSSYSFSYHKPNEANGTPVTPGSSGNDQRTSGASIWKTVAEATGIPSSIYNSYTDVQGAPLLSFLLKA